MCVPSASSSTGGDLDSHIKVTGVILGAKIQWG